MMTDRTARNTAWRLKARQYPDYFFCDRGRWYPVLAGGKGGSSGSSTTTVNVPGPTTEEIEIQKNQVKLQELQLEEIRRQNAALAEVFPLQKDALRVQTEAAIASTTFFKKELERAEKGEGEFAETPKQKEIRELAEDRTLGILKGEAPPVTPAREALIDTIFGSAEAEGKTSIRQFAEELASSRGLKLTDTPIGNEVLRETGRFQQGLQGAKAAAKLDIGREEEVFGENVRMFQENLRQTAFQNRLSLLGRSGGGGGGGGAPLFATGAAGEAMTSTQGFLDNLQRERQGRASSTTTTRTRGGGFDPTSLFGPAIGAGGALGAAAILAPAAAGSSATLKKAIVPYDQDEYDRALEKVNATPITRWKYLWEGDDVRPHTGPILELSPEDIKADDTHLDLLSYSGLQHAALKAVDRKVERVMALIAEGAKEHARKGRRRHATPA